MNPHWYLSFGECYSEYRLMNFGYQFYSKLVDSENKILLSIYYSLSYFLM